VSNENVVPFRVITSVKASKPEVVTADFTPEQTELIQSITDMVEFMLENKHAIRNFVCSFSMDAPNGTDTECRVLSSPIEARDFALLIKVLENSFFRNLNGG
jgi:hypothetical protein